MKRFRIGVAAALIVVGSTAAPAAGGLGLVDPHLMPEGPRYMFGEPDAPPNIAYPVGQWLLTDWLVRNFVIAAVPGVGAMRPVRPVSEAE